MHRAACCVQLLAELERAIVSTQEALQAAAEGERRGDGLGGQDQQQHAAAHGEAGGLSATVQTLAELQAPSMNAAESEAGGSTRKRGPPSPNEKYGAAGKVARVEGSDGAGAGQAHAQIRNPRMHPANLYFNQEPDFAALAGQQPQYNLQQYMNVGPTGRAAYQFGSWEATRALTAALLAQHFDVRGWWLPEGQLIPPVTNRTNYLHWISDLLTLSSPPGAGQQQGRHEAKWKWKRSGVGSSAACLCLCASARLRAGMRPPQGGICTRSQSAACVRACMHACMYAHVRRGSRVRARPGRRLRRVVHLLPAGRGHVRLAHDWPGHHRGESRPAALARACTCGPLRPTCSRTFCG